MNAYLLCSAILVIVYFLLANNVVAVTVCRVLHPISILMAPDLNGRYVPRFIAALGTYLGGLALGVALLMRALMS